MAAGFQPIQAGPSYSEVSSGKTVATGACKSESERHYARPARRPKQLLPLVSQALGIPWRIDRGMDHEITIDNLSEAFGFKVSSGFKKAILAAIARSPETPHRGLNKFGLDLGGPLYAFLGGESAQSLRCPQMPPEFFPFAVRRSNPNIYLGFLVDNPSLDGEANTTFAVCVPEHPKRSGVVARDEQELFRWLGAYLDNPDTLGVSRSSNAYNADEVRQWRCSQLTYRTADQMGVVVPEENTPLSLLHEEMRCVLVEKRDVAKAKEVGQGALKVGAPGAALALARDITWWLGHRDHWFQLATDLYVEAYAQLGRPLFTRIVRREWVRLYGGR
jgi:hypothetical protein